MIYWLVIFPVGFMIIVIVIALIVGKRDRKKQAMLNAERKNDLLTNDPKRAVYEYLNDNKEFCEYLLNDIKIGKSQIDCLYISKKGVFIICTLPNQGTVSGDANGEYWVNNNQDDYVINNPFLANEKPLEMIGNIINQTNDLSIVAVFTKATEINVVNSKYPIVRLSGLMDAFKAMDDIYEENDLMVVYNKIFNYLSSQED